MSDDDHLHSIIADYRDACAEMQAELDRLRADAVRRIEENDRVLIANGRLRAELAAKDKRYDDAVEAVDLKDKELIQERGVSRDLRKRVGELEGLFSHVGVETHKWFDPECGHEGCQSLVLKARAEQAESQLATANVHRDAAIASSDAFAIELVAKDARIAELENKNSYNLQIVREATARIAELEKLEADALQCASVEADLRREFHARAERAEAERDVMRKALELVDADVRHHLRSDAIDHALLRKNTVAAVRAALAPSHAGPDRYDEDDVERLFEGIAPSPAGREERHEMTSIGDKEPD